MFKSRTAAGKLLGIAVAEALTGIPDERPVRTVVVALSRGGAIVAKEVATLLCAHLTILVSKLIHAPSGADKTLAVVTSRGTVVLSEDFDHSIEGLPSYVRTQQMQLAKMAKTLEQHWLDEAQYQPPSLGGKRVVLVSDGSPSGLTELAALRTVRPDRPRQLILATPVLAHSAHRLVQYECDLIISLINKDVVQSVNRHYEDFPHVSDAEIVAALKTANTHGPFSQRKREPKT